MTDLHLKLPFPEVTSFFLWLFGKSSRAYFLALVLLFVHLPWPDRFVVAQTQPSAKLAIGHDFWGFKENAPQGASCFTRRSAINCFRRTSTPCSRLGLAAFGSATRSEGLASCSMEGSRTMVKPPPQQDPCATLPKTGMESYGPPQAAACGNSGVLNGRRSELNRTHSRDPSLRRGSIRKELFGFWLASSRRPMKS